MTGLVSVLAVKILHGTANLTVLYVSLSYGQFLVIHKSFGFRLHARNLAKSVNFRQIKFSPAAYRQSVKLNIGITYSLKTADLKTESFPQTANLTLTTFLENHVVPLVNAFSADIFNAVKVSRTVFKFNTGLELTDLISGNTAENSDFNISFGGRGDNSTYNSFSKDDP